MKIRIAVVLALSVLAGAASAQQPAPATGTAVPLVVETAVSTKTAKVGDTVALSVAEDVGTPGQVVIPRGSKAEARVTWRTGNGGYGKSGKLEITYIRAVVDGRDVPLTGTHREEGKGRPGAVLLGGAFLKGNEAIVEKGRRLAATLAAASQP